MAAVDDYSHHIFNQQAQAYQYQHQQYQHQQVSAYSNNTDAAHPQPPHHARAVPAPSNPLIPDDDDYSFSHQQQHQHQQPPPHPHLQTQHLARRAATPPLSAYASSLGSSTLDVNTPSSTVQAPFVYPIGVNLGYSTVPEGEFSFECGLQQGGNGSGYSYESYGSYGMGQQQQQQQQYYQQQPQAQQQSQSQPLPRLQLNPHRTSSNPTPNAVQQQQSPHSRPQPPSQPRQPPPVTNDLNGIPTTTNAKSQPVLSLSSIARQIATKANANANNNQSGSGSQSGVKSAPQSPQPQPQPQTQSNPYPQLQPQQQSQFHFTLPSHVQTQLQQAQGQVQVPPVQATTYAFGQDTGYGMGYEMGVGMGGMGMMGGEQAKRPGGACTRCKKMKMKCTFLTPTSPSCQRCLTTSHPCIVEGRKPRTPSQREALLAQIREKDAIIARLLGPFVKEREGDENTMGISKVVLMGGKVVNALEGANSREAPRRGMSLDAAGGSQNGSRRSSLTPIPERASTMPMPVTRPVLGATERAALMSAEKGASAGAVGVGKGLYGLTGLGKKAVQMQDKGGGDEDSDEEWSSEESESEGWDEEVEKKWGQLSASISKFADKTRPTTVSLAKEGEQKRIPLTALHPYSLPTRDAPMGLIARLSLEEAEERALEDILEEANEGSDMEDKDQSTEPKSKSRHQNSKRPRDDAEADTSSDSDSPPTPTFGIASPSYFLPGPSANLALRRILNSRSALPPILASGLITWPEAETLFDTFYSKCAVFVSVLDGEIHTPRAVLERDGFLFTTVCTIASRYNTSRPDLHKAAMHYAKHMAATSLIDGIKSVEMAQAYLLMSTYCPPARRWEEDRSWFYSGLASRIATDLNLSASFKSGSDSKPLSERHERERLNRVRTWLNCWNVDRSSGVQFGKPTGLVEDEAVRGAKEWYRRALRPYNESHDSQGSQGKDGEEEVRVGDRYDVHLVAYTELLRVMSRFHERVASGASGTSGGVRGRCDFKAATETTEAELQVWRTATDWSYEHESDQKDEGSKFRTKGLIIFENYMRLVMYSFGFEDAWNRRRSEIGQDLIFFVKCLQSATAVVKQLCDVYAPSGYLVYAPDCFFVMGGFSGAFLLKMLRPEFSSLLDSVQRDRIITLIERFITVLGSKDAAIDATHTPMLYSKFLRGQLNVTLAEAKEHAEAKAQARAELQAQQSQQYIPRIEEPSPSTQDIEDNTDNLSDRASTSGSSSFLIADASTPSTHSSDHSASVSVVHTPDAAQWAELSFANSAENVNGYANADALSNGSGSQTAYGGAQGNYEYNMSSGAGMGVGGGDGMELCEDEYLATMRVVSNDQWRGTLLMPGFRWAGWEDIVMADATGAGAGYNAEYGSGTTYGQSAQGYGGQMPVNAMSAGADVDVMWGGVGNVGVETH